MRLATEIQEEETSKRNPARNHKPTTRSRPKNAMYNQIAGSRLLESTEHFALVARATNDAIRDWDVESGALDWPQGLDSLLGYVNSKATNEINFWRTKIHPQDRARTSASLRAALDSGDLHWTGEYRFRRADGTYLDLLERALIIRDSAGVAVRVVGSLMDVTARKQLQDQLVRSQKMEAFGQLAGGVAHDYNNFLTTILGYCDLLLDELGMESENSDHIGEIRSAAGRASMLTAQLLAFSRTHPLAPRVIDVNSFLANLERSLFRLLGEDISVECNFGRAKEGMHTKVDPGQLTQIILNLVVNARDAMPTGGRLSLETSLLCLKTDGHDSHAEDLPPGEYIRISISDNGMGMTDEAKHHLFEPFFTTKDAGNGGGLGLATSYGIVRQSGGNISVESELGKGTTVTLLLPKVPTPPPPLHKRVRKQKMPTGVETILVLEDDVSVRHIAVRVLRSLGYDVIEAANGDDAQRLISKGTGKKIDLLLTDMVMPQMSGRRFADWLRKTSPQTKVIFISGYLEESLHPGDRRGREMFFLPKPFDPEQLATKIRQALDLVPDTH